jgi:CRISPR-associated protein Cas1
VLRHSLRTAASAQSAPTLLGIEGSAAAAYFAVLPGLLSDTLPATLRIASRSKRPPKDPVNALLSFGYGLLYRLVTGAIVSVGLHPGVGLEVRLLEKEWLGEGGLFAGLRIR